MAVRLSVLCPSSLNPLGAAACRKRRREREGKKIIKRKEGKKGKKERRKNLEKWLFPDSDQRPAPSELSGYSSLVSCLPSLLSGRWLPAGQPSACPSQRCSCGPPLRAPPGDPEPLSLSVIDWLCCRRQAPLVTQRISLLFVLWFASPRKKKNHLGQSRQSLQLP